MTKSRAKEIKELERMASRIAKKKQRLEAQMKEEKETAKWYDQVLKESGFKRPRDFIKALMGHFGLRTVSANGSGKGRGPGRPPKAESSGGTSRRKRTRITPEIRDKVKGMLEEGTSKNATSKQTGISYIVVKKIEDGAYDKL